MIRKTKKAAILAIVGIMLIAAFPSMNVSAQQTISTELIPEGQTETIVDGSYWESTFDVPSNADMVTLSVLARLIHYYEDGFHWSMKLWVNGAEITDGNLLQDPQIGYMPNHGSFNHNVDTDDDGIMNDDDWQMSYGNNYKTGIDAWILSYDDNFNPDTTGGSYYKPKTISYEYKWEITSLVTSGSSYTLIVENENAYGYSIEVKTATIDVYCDDVKWKTKSDIQVQTFKDDFSDEILFQDDFEGYTDNDWSSTWGSKENGVWTIANVDGNEVFEAKSDESHRGTTIFAGDTSWTDYTLEARIWTSDTYWGLIYRADADGRTYYDAYINTGGYIEIWKHSDGIWGRTKLVKDTITSPTISANTWYMLKVIVEGNNIKLFVAQDGSAYPSDPQVDYTDSSSPYASGRIGLLFYDIGGPSECAARFDDVKVYVPAKADQWTPVSGTWQGNWEIENGEYSAVCPGTHPGYAVSYMKDLTVNDFTMEFKTKILETFTNGTDFTGVFFRTSSQSDVFGWAGAGSGNGYLAIIRANMEVALFKSIGTTNVQIARATTSIDPTQDYVTFRVEARGSNIQVYVNNDKFIDANDDTYSSGYVALHPGRVHAHFGNIKVTGYVDLEFTSSFKVDGVDKTGETEYFVTMQVKNPSVSDTSVTITDVSFRNHHITPAKQASIETVTTSGLPLTIQNDGSTGSFNVYMTPEFSRNHATVHLWIEYKTVCDDVYKVGVNVMFRA